MKSITFAAALLAAALSTANAAPVAPSTESADKAGAPVSTSVTQERICLRCRFGV